MDDTQSCHDPLVRDRRAGVPFQHPTPSERERWIFTSTESQVRAKGTPTPGRPLVRMADAVSWGSKSCRIATSRYSLRP